MKTKFKVGQSVWDDVHYPGIEGKVVEVIDGVDFPVWASFRGQEASYTNAGAWLVGGKPCLSLIPYTFELPKQPDTFGPGELVLVRDSDDEVWRAIRVSGDNLTTEGYYTDWKYMIKFDAELALTNKKP